MFLQHLAAIAARISRPPCRVTDAGWERSLLLTVDDGGKSAMYIAECLAEHRWKAHFLITTNYIDTPGFVSRGDIAELAAQGHVIGSHSCSHVRQMWSLSHDELLAEWSNSREKLQSILGSEILCASVPYGYYSESVAKSASKAGIRVLFNSEPVRSVTEFEGCRIVGRYAIVDKTSPQQAADLAAGRTLTCLKKTIWWNTKKLVKRALGPNYDTVRGALVQTK